MALVYNHGHSPLLNVFGVVTGSATAIQFPSGICWQVAFKANDANIGTFFIGNSNLQEWGLDAGQETQWALAYDLNQFYYRNPSGTSDYLTWWLVR